MSPGRRWVLRSLVAAAAFVLVETVLLLLRTDPDPVRLALLVVLIALAAYVVGDHAALASARWPLPVVPQAGLARADLRTATYLSLISNHLTGSETDAKLRDRLRSLTELVLRVRHDLTLDDPRAEALIGPELADVLARRPRRLSVAEIDRCLSRIEAM